MVHLMPLSRLQPHRSSPVPVWRQAYDHIAAAIASGELAPGEMLPGELRLADEWDIAINTLRQALRKLAEDGLVVRSSGKGTFVADTSA
jgi:DNA-binding GntR family transcriptional regulator